MIKVKLPTLLRRHTGGTPEVEGHGSTVGELLDDLEARYPGLARSVRDDDGSLHGHVNVYVNGEDVRYRGSIDTPLAEGDQVAILPAVAGG